MSHTKCPNANANGATLIQLFGYNQLNTISWKSCVNAINDSIQLIGSNWIAELPRVGRNKDSFISDQLADDGY